MEYARFDTLTRDLSSFLSRRTLAGALGLAALAYPGSTDAKKKKKRKKKKKVKFNDFGCVNVGSFCKNSGQCCSGICSGKKDKKKCKAHDASTCQPNQDTCLGFPFLCTTGTGNPGQCLITTGEGSYCFGGSGDCHDCKKDADCVPFCGAQAACIVCATCAGESLNNTACVGPEIDSCDFGP